MRAGQTPYRFEEAPGRELEMQTPGKENDWQKLQCRFLPYTFSSLNVLSDNFLDIPLNLCSLMD